MRSDHTYRPDEACDGCAKNFPLGSSGCHRKRDGRYPDDKSSMENGSAKGERQQTADPYSGN